MIILKINTIILGIIILLSTPGICGGAVGTSVTCIKYSKRYHYFLNLHNRVSQMLQKGNTLLRKVPINKKSLKKRLMILTKRLEYEEIRLKKKLTKAEILLVKKKCPDSKDLSKFNL